MNGSTGTILYFVVLIAIFYFLMIRPQQKQAKARKQMLNALKNGDSIITSSGIYGKIVKLKDDYFIMETGPDRVKIKLQREAIGIVEKSAEKEKPDTLEEPEEEIQEATEE